MANVNPAYAGYGDVKFDGFGYVSPVPLPASFPMFASALTVLGIVGYVLRKRDTTVAG
jgi:hypothetical protein